MIGEETTERGGTDIETGLPQGDEATGDHQAPMAVGKTLAIHCVLSVIRTCPIPWGGGMGRDGTLCQMLVQGFGFVFDGPIFLQMPTLFKELFLLATSKVILSPQ